MGGTPVSHKGLVIKVVMEDLWEVPPTDLTHRSRVQVRDRKDHRHFVFPAEEETDLRHKDLLTDRPEKVLHSFRSVRHVGDERVDECQSPDFESPLKWTFDHPDKYCKTQSENDVEYQGKDCK